MKFLHIGFCLLFITGNVRSNLPVDSLANLVPFDYVLEDLVEDFKVLELNGGDISKVRNSLMSLYQGKSWVINRLQSMPEGTQMTPEIRVKLIEDIEVMERVASNRHKILSKLVGSSDC